MQFLKIWLLSNDHLYYYYFCFLLGSTERAVLANSDRIVIDSLPLEKLQKYYAEVPNSCREVVLGYVSYYESITLVRLHKEFAQGKDMPF